MAGATVTEPHRDRHGWDLQIALPPLVGVTSTIPIPVPELVCLAQVKATRNRTLRRLSVKFSSLLKLAEQPLPTFIVVPVFEPDSERPTAAFLVHIADEWIDRILRRHWQENAKWRRAGKSGEPAWHQMTMDIAWSAKDRLPEPTGSALLKAIRGYVGDPHEYVLRKVAHFNDTGFDKRRHQIMFRTPGAREQVHRAMAELAVGLRDSVAIADLRHSVVRFDTPVSTGDFDNPTREATIHLPVLPSIGSTRVTIGTGTDTAEFTCATYFSGAVFPQLPREHLILRCVTPLIDLRHKVGDKTGKTHIALRLSPQCSYRLSELASLGRLLRLVSTGSNVSATISIETRAGTQTLSGTLSNASIASDFLEFGQVMEQAAVVARQFGLHDDPWIDHAELYRQKANVGVLVNALTNSEVLSMRVSAPVSKPRKPYADAAYLLAPSIALGRHVLAAILAAVGVPTWRNTSDGSYLDIDTTDIRVLSKKTADRRKWRLRKADLLAASRTFDKKRTLLLRPTLRRPK